MSYEKPTESVVCDGCETAEHTEWQPIVWDFDEGNESLNSARGGFCNICTQCGLIQKISLGEHDWWGEEWMED